MTKSIAAALAAYASDEDLKAAKMRLGAAMPDDGWLADYLRAVTPLTDAPPEFHLISGLCALSAAVGNRLYTESWGQNVFPHLWAVLVAPSSFWRKSTAISQAERMLRGASEGIVYPSDFSREKLLKLLSDQPGGMLTLKEFGGFLSMLGRDYMSGTKETLTELYDGPDVYSRALQSGVIEVKRPALTLLGATTLDWLESKITDGDLQGGFLARFLFVTARQKASPKGMTGGIDPATRASLSLYLLRLHELPETEVRFEPEARELLDEWALGWEDEVGRTKHRSDLSGFAVRLQTYALKFAVLYRLSAQHAHGGEAHVVDEASAAQAIAYCRSLWSSVSGLIDEDIAITKDAKDLRRIRAIIGSGITRSDALRLSKMRKRDFDQILDTLVQGGGVYQYKARSSTVGLERARDTQVTWLSPVAPSTNGHHSSSLGGPEVPDIAGGWGSEEFQGEPEESDNPREPQDDSLNSSSSSTSTSPVHLSPSHVSRINTRDTRGRAKRNADQSTDPVEDRDDAEAFL